MTHILFTCQCKRKCQCKREDCSIILTDAEKTAATGDMETMVPTVLSSRRDLSEVFFQRLTHRAKAGPVCPPGYWSFKVSFLRTKAGGKEFSRTRLKGHNRLARLERISQSSLQRSRVTRRCCSRTRDTVFCHLVRPVACRSRLTAPNA